MADIVLLRVRAESAHHHVVLHPLAQWVDRSGCCNHIHGKFLLVEGTTWSNSDSAPPKAEI
jgi:hypothetical protein